MSKMLRASSRNSSRSGLNGVAVDALGPVPLVVGGRLRAADAAAGEEALEAALGAALALAFGEQLEGLDRPEPISHPQAGTSVSQ
jgi:hypothetical protein